MQSFLGWIGGKSALRNAILNRFPDKVGRYIEVFGGAGWVLFGRDPVPGQMEVFNDADGELINIYRCVKYHPEALQKELDGLPDSREVFFDYAAQEHIRGMTDIQRAARSLYGDCQIEPLTRLNQLPAAGPTEYKELLVCNYL